MYHYLSSLVLSSGTCRPLSLWTARRGQQVPDHSHVALPVYCWITAWCLSLRSFPYPVSHSLTVPVCVLCVGMCESVCAVCPYLSLTLPACHQGPVLPIPQHAASSWHINFMNYWYNQCLLCPYCSVVLRTGTGWVLSLWTLWKRMKKRVYKHIIISNKCPSRLKNVFWNHTSAVSLHSCFDLSAEDNFCGRTSVFSHMFVPEWCNINEHIFWVQMCDRSCVPLW